ncbi:hypothetical protein ACFX10_026844 [Malus domestica]
MAQACNHTSAEVRTYQRKPSTTTPYQQVGSRSQIQPNEKTSTFQTVAVPPPTLLNTLPSQQTYQSQGKRKDFHPHQSHFSKRSKGHYCDNQGYCHDNPRPQAVNTVGQVRVRTAPTLRYEVYTPLNATCVAIYPRIAHRYRSQSQCTHITSPRRTQARFAATTSITAMTARNVSTQKIHPQKLHQQKLHQQKLHQWRTTTKSQKLHTILLKIV